MGGYWYGIRRIIAMNEDDARLIYKKVVEANKESDMQDPMNLSRESFDEATKDFYKDEGEVHYCQNTDSMFVEETIDTDHPEPDKEVNEKVDEHQAKIESGEIKPTMPADIPARDEEKRKEYLEEAVKKEEEAPSKTTPDADELEMQEAKEKNELPVEEQVKQVEETEETGETENPILKDIREGDARSSIIAKYRKADFVKLANELGLSSEGTTPELYDIIKNSQ